MVIFLQNINPLIMRKDNGFMEDKSIFRINVILTSILTLALICFFMQWDELDNPIGVKLLFIISTLYAISTTFPWKMKKDK